MMNVQETINIPKGAIKGRYPDLKGKDWINSIEPEDKAVLIRCGQSHSQYGVLGGKANAQSCQRDYRGRFAKKQ